MTPYVLDEWKHRKAFVHLLEVASSVVEQAPSTSDGAYDLTRCHDLVRAVWMVLREEIKTWPFALAARTRLHIVDGKYLNRFEHSWLGLEIENENALLDVYAVGQLPPVQLHSTSMGLCEIYNPHPLGGSRTDINENHVTAIVSAWQRRGGRGQFR